MDAILHILGTCSDNHSHIDLIDILIMLGGGGAGALTIKMYYKTIMYIIKEKLTNLLK